MPSYKLIYFDLRARGEVTRMVFAAAGQKYEEVRVTFDDWPKTKPTMPFGQLPVLEVDGKAYTQTPAIIDYIAAKLGFHGATAEEKLRVNEVVNLSLDLLVAIGKCHFEKDEAAKGQLKEKLKNEEFPKYLAYFEKLVDSKTGYFVGSKLTAADMAVHDVLAGPLKHMPDLLASYPKVKANRAKVEAHPKLGPYLKSRKWVDL